MLNKNGLYMGNLINAKNLKLLKTLKINYVLSLT